MKRVIILLASAVAVMLVVLTLTGSLYSQQAQAPLVGVVDLLQISKKWTKWSRLEKLLEKEDKKFKEELGRLNIEVVQKERELKEYKEGSESHIKAQKEYAEKLIDFRAYRNTGGEKFKKKAEGYMRDLVTDVEEEIIGYGRAHNFTVIIKKQDVSVKGRDWAQLQYYVLNKSVMFWHPKTDITKEMLKILNKKHK